MKGDTAMAIHKVNLTEKEAKNFNEENKLKPEELEAVNGGYIHLDKSIDRYEIIDDLSGKVLDTGWRSPDYCGEAAERRFGVSAKEITDEQLKELRNDPWGLKWMIIGD